MSTMEKINDTIFGAKNVVKELIKKAHDKHLEAELGRCMMETRHDAWNCFKIE
jgi:DNA-directed RNA polymerase II subunit RPB1